MAEGIAGGFVIATQEIHVEDVFPGASAHGARFDIAEADVAQSEDAERLEERPGQILHLESDRSLVGAGRNQALVAGGVPSSPRRLANQEKAGEVAFVVLDAGLENLAGVFARGVTSGDAGSVGKAMSDDVLHASSRVVERDRLDSGMVAKEIAALVERHRV